MLVFFAYSAFVVGIVTLIERKRKFNFRINRERLRILEPRSLGQSPTAAFTNQYSPLLLS